MVSWTQNLWYNTLLGVIMLGVWGLIEPIRLYCGYFGNLKESVSTDFFHVTA